MNTRLNTTGSAHKMVLLASMYFCQAIPMGYAFGSLPVIMREDGVSLAHIGMLFVLHLPWAFKFLLASRVDRYYLPWLGRRRSWIFPLQWVAACLLLVAARTPPDSAFNAMFAVMFILNSVLATNDVAVDGYATDMLEEGERAWGNTIQAGARYVGLFLGGGLMLTLHRSMGWASLCTSLAAVVFLLSLPVLLHREIPATSGGDASGEAGVPGVRGFLGRQDVRWLLPVLIAPTAFAFCAYQMRMPLFVDLGLSSSDIGRLMMHYAVPSGAAGTIASAWFMNRFGTRAFIRFFCVAAILVSACSIRLSSLGSATLPDAGVILCVDNVLTGGVNVWAFTLMMRVSAGRYAGTGFAVLSSLFILVPLSMAPVLGKLGDAWGFTFLYSLLTGFIFAGFLVAESTLRLSRGRVGSSIDSRGHVPGTEFQGERK